MANSRNSREMESLVNRHPNQKASGYRSLEERLPPLSRTHCEALITKQITQLAMECDFVVRVIYDREQGSLPIDYTLYDFQKDSFPEQVPTSLDFEGIWVWYFCKREKNSFKARKLLIEIEDGHYLNGQFGDFEGFWDEFSQYVTDDRWVKAAFNQGN